MAANEEILFDCAERLERLRGCWGIDCHFCEGRGLRSLGAIRLRRTPAQERRNCPTANIPGAITHQYINAFGMTGNSPLALSMSNPPEADRSWFDRLTTNGLTGYASIRLR